MAVTAREKSKRKRRATRRKTGRAHDATSGEYVTEEYARANPEKVVEETRLVEEPEVPALEPTLD
jgi:hypothetical protein